MNWQDLLLGTIIVAAWNAFLLYKMRQNEKKK